MLFADGYLYMSCSISMEQRGYVHHWQWVCMLLRSHSMVCRTTMLLRLSALKLAGLLASTQPSPLWLVSTVQGRLAAKAPHCIATVVLHSPRPSTSSQSDLWARLPCRSAQGSPPMNPSCPRRVTPRATLQAAPTRRQAFGPTSSVAASLTSTRPPAAGPPFLMPAA